MLSKLLIPQQARNMYRLKDETGYVVELPISFLQGTFGFQPMEVVLGLLHWYIGMEITQIRWMDLSHRISLLRDTVNAVLRRLECSMKK
jgi:hypothetical protein